MVSKMKFFKLLINIYIDAFKHGLSRKLFLLIAVKMFILFAILKLFFFHDYLDEKFKNDDIKKGQYVFENLVGNKINNNSQNVNNLKN